MTCARIGGFPCRVLALLGERGVFAIAQPRTLELVKRACETGDASACGEHATVEETFAP